MSHAPFRRLPRTSRWWLGAIAASVLVLAACDQRRADQLQPGVATEADVRAQFGEPTLIVERADGSKRLEYPRQPEGWTNYVMVIGTDGRLATLTQQLTPENFATVQPGMAQLSVRDLLGKPARIQRFALKPDEEHWEWRFQKPDGTRQVFSVSFDRDRRVSTAAVGDDPRDSQVGGK